jgi:hypothetical protein
VVGIFVLGGYGTIYILFSFQCDDLVKQKVELLTELELVKKNHRICANEMDTKVLELDIIRKQKNWNG